MTSTVSTKRYRRSSRQRPRVLIEQVMSSDTQVRSFFQWGMWAYGADSPAAVIRATDPYTLEGYAPLITCPTLVLDGEIDLPLVEQPSQLYEALRCQKTYHPFPATEGGGQHRQEGAMSRLHQVVFDWLDTALVTVSTR